MATKLAEYKFSTDYESFSKIKSRLCDALGSTAYYNLSFDDPSSSSPGYIRIYDNLSDDQIVTAGKICRAHGGEAQ